MSEAVLVIVIQLL